VQATHHAFAYEKAGALEFSIGLGRSSVRKVLQLCAYARSCRSLGISASRHGPTFSCLTGSVFLRLFLTGFQSFLKTVLLRILDELFEKPCL
jgi:hypothetical protein